MNRIIVGVTGPTAGGKGTVAAFLTQKGCKYFSLSDELRKEAAKRGLTAGKEVLQNLGDELRAKLGDEILAKRVVETNEFKNANKVVIDGLRNPAEINYLRNFFEAKIIGVTASQKKRFEYSLARKREGDPTTIEEFIRLDNRELVNGEVSSHAIQVNECLKLSNIVIYNESGKERLLTNLEFSLRRLEIDLPKVSREREV